MRWAGYVARIEEERRFWWESLEEREHLEDRGIDERMGVRMNIGKIGWGGGEMDSVGSG
jgi:hypothetical protein